MPPTLPVCSLAPRPGLLQGSLAAPLCTLWLLSTPHPCPRSWGFCKVSFLGGFCKGLTFLPAPTPRGAGWRAGGPQPIQRLGRRVGEKELGKRQAFVAGRHVLGALCHSRRCQAFSGNGRGTRAMASDAADAPASAPGASCPCSVQALAKGTSSLHLASGSPSWREKLD